MFEGLLFVFSMFFWLHSHSHGLAKTGRNLDFVVDGQLWGCDLPYFKEFSVKGSYYQEVVYQK